MAYQNPPYYISAYALACKRGFVGSLDDWLASLKGEKGDTGSAAEIKGRYLTIAALEAAHPTGEIGDYYAVGETDDTQEVYYWESRSGEWTKIPFRGEKGDTGTTAYEYAVLGGYTGTEEQFEALMNSVPGYAQTASEAAAAAVSAANTATGAAASASDSKIAAQSAEGNAQAYASAAASGANAAASSASAAETSKNNAAQLLQSTTEAAAAGAQSAQQAQSYASSAGDSAVSARDSKNSAAASAAESEANALRAEQAANRAGYFYFEIDEYGHLIETKTEDTSDDLSFSLEDGRLIVTYE